MHPCLCCNHFEQKLEHCIQSELVQVMTLASYLQVNGQPGNDALCEPSS